MRTFYVIADLVQSATLFREAAGVFHYLSQDGFSPFETAKSTESPPEAKSYLSTVMSFICLAEAQVCLQAITHFYLLDVQIAFNHDINNLQWSCSFIVT